MYWVQTLVGSRVHRFCPPHPFSGGTIIRTYLKWVVRMEMINDWDQGSIPHNVWAVSSSGEHLKLVLESQIKESSLKNPKVVKVENSAEKEIIQYPHGKTQNWSWIQQIKSHASRNSQVNNEKSMFQEIKKKWKVVNFKIPDFSKTRWQ